MSEWERVREKESEQGRGEGRREGGWWVRKNRRNRDIESERENKRNEMEGVVRQMIYKILVLTKSKTKNDF